jgi:molybdopterin-guanine dinucleotide biosynthesis protein A
MDVPGKDSYRFFSAKADVCFHSQKEHFWRTHFSDSFSLDIFLRKLSRQYDLVLVEGYKEAMIPKVLLLNSENMAPEVHNGKILGRFEFAPGRMARLYELLVKWLPEQWNKAPVYGCVLIGGKSTRMGHPKHLIEKDGRTWLEHTVLKLAPFCTEVVVAGNHDMPGPLNISKLPDIPEITGPLGGIGAAMRWNPWASWIIVACDLPDISAEAIDWLLQQRKPGAWAVFPSIDGQKVEPLFALYDFRIEATLEEMIYNGEMRPSRLSKENKVKIAPVPENLQSSWRNVNYPQEI